MGVDLLPQSVLGGSSEGVNDDSIVVSTKMIESVTFDSKAKGTLSRHLALHVLNITL